MSEPASFFVPEDGAFRATIATRGPWSVDHQHGGPPAALLVNAIEKTVERSAFRAARFLVQFLRPIPIDLFRVEVEPAKGGKKVKTVRARLVDAQDREVATAEALFIRRADLDVGPATPESPPDPEGCAPFTFPFFVSPAGYQTSMEARHVSGTWGSGKLALWMRMRLPLLPGQAPSPLERVVIAADSGNGLAVALDLAKYTFVNPDLAVYLAREPSGEWVGLDAETTFGTDGIGLCQTRIFDVGGAAGRGAQSLIVERRPNE